MKINKNQLGKGIYTEDNLVAGTNISITQVQQPIIDENTLAVWHFDDSFANAVSGGTVGDFYLDGSSSSSFSSAISKFGGVSLHCNNSGNDRSIVYPNSISFGENNFTVDFWIYLTSDFALYSTPFWLNLKGLGDVRIYQNKFQFLVSGVVKAESENYEDNSWMHFAVERSSSTLNFYLNGTKFGTTTSSNSLTDITLQQQQAGTYVYLDEFRLSNVARYNGQDFTPFNEPYASASGPAQYQINNTQQEANVLDYYGTCDTAATERDKIVSCSGFSLKTGVSIRVKFTNAQNYNSSFLSKLRLNVNNTGLISVNSIGTTAAVRYCWAAGEVVAFTYDGTNWLIQKGGIASAGYYGMTKLNTSALSSDATTSLTPSALNGVYVNVISNYPIYSSSSTYAVGDRVRWSYAVYECNTAIDTAESWTAAHWTQVDTLQEQIIANKAIAADTSLSNIISAGKKVIAHNALPSTASTSWTDLTLGASQATYTMPDDGIVCFNTAGGTVGGYILIGSGNYVNIAYASQTWLVLRVWLFVPKGEQFTVHYSNAGTLQAFGYYKLVGNN